MSYIPKTVKCKMNFKSLTDAEIRKSCAFDSEVEVVKKFYEKLDGAVLILSLWDYDNHEKYHLTSWENDTDNLMMEAMFILEKEFGVYSDFEEFKKDWKEGEYDSGGVTVFPKNCVEELEIICEELKPCEEKGIKVYKMNDCDWMAAHTPEEAAEEYKKQCDLTDDGIEYPLAECDLDKEGLVVDIDELTAEETSLHKNFKKYGDRLYAWFSFRECLREHLRDSDDKPYLIASTEC